MGLLNSLKIYLSTDKGKQLNYWISMYVLKGTLKIKVWPNILLIRSKLLFFFCFFLMMSVQLWVKTNLDLNWVNMDPGGTARSWHSCWLRRPAMPSTCHLSASKFSRNLPGSLLRSLLPKFGILENMSGNVLLIFTGWQETWLLLHYENIRMKERNPREACFIGGG